MNLYVIELSKIENNLVWKYDEILITATNIENAIKKIKETIRKDNIIISEIKLKKYNILIGE